MENASDDKAAHAANSGREDSWLTRRTEQATPGKGRHERSMWNPLRVDEKNGAADTEREDSWLARQADPGTPNEDEVVDGGPLTRPPKDGLQVVDAVAVAALDTDTRDVDGCAAPGDKAGDGYTAPGVLERNKGELHLILRRCPRHRKHTRRRVGMLRFATQGLCEAKNPGSVINNCGGYVQSAVPDLDGFKLEVKAEIHHVRCDKTKVSQSATADPAGLDADFMNAARDTGVSESSGYGTADMYDVKLGNEVKAEMHDVRRDKTKGNQSVSLGTK